MSAVIRAWNGIIRPIAEAVEARSILEIGSEVGLSTQVLLNYVRKFDGYLYAVDPCPSFDVSEFESKNKGYLTYYTELSLEALRRVPALDLALLDGDHNWYTVYNELKLIEERHDHSPIDVPVIVAHDTAWPYGRRDLYYNPETIPAEFRHPYAQQGIAYGKSELVGGRGMNSNMFNALHEGGARNGVMTGIEDFLNESSIEWHVINIPLYYGLTILVSRNQLEANISLEARILHLESQLKASELIDFGEQLRIAEGIAFQKVHRELQDTKARVNELESELARYKESEQFT